MMTWPKSTGPTRRDERREAIVEGALRLFAEHGALPVRVEDIAAEVGISRATFYKYFSERDEVLAELFRRLLATTSPVVEADGSAVERIAALLIDTAARMVEQEQLSRFVYTLPLRHDALLGDEASRPAFMDGLHRLVAEGIAARELRDDLAPETVTGHIVHAFEQAMRDWAAGHAENPPGHVARLIDLALNGCRPAGAAR
jgi:AcrR family transcriptional regulator